jgi:hypothetical protein
MKRKNIITLILASLFIFTAFHGGTLHAQSSIAGDTVCGGSGATECKLSDLKVVSQGIFKLIISIGLPLLVVFIVYRIVMAWYALQQGNANAYKEASKKITEAIIGFIIIVALFGGIFLAMLKYIGASDFTTKLLREISSMELIPHTYAATSVCAPPKKGETCYFTASKTKLVGTITDSGSMFDLSLFCKDPITELTSNTDFVNSTNYWKGSTDCAEKINGTVCDLGPTYYNTMGICSSSYVPAAQTGPAECLGKVDKTFCKARPSWNVLGSAGVCNLKGTTFTCDLASPGDTCFSPTTQKKGTISDINGFCGVVGDPCTTSSGTQGVYSSTYVCIVASQPATVSTPATTNTGATTATAATTQVPTSCGFAGLPNPLGFCSLYDFILGALNLVMKFFLYPALIAIWVWSGFLYVLAQGAPEKLSKAHKLLIWAFISTLIVFTVQGFLVALRGSVNKILSATPSVEVFTNKEGISRNKVA